MSAVGVAADAGVVVVAADDVGAGVVVVAADDVGVWSRTSKASMRAMIPCNASCMSCIAVTTVAWCA